MLTEKEIQLAIAKAVWHDFICIPNLSLGSSNGKNDSTSFYDADLVLISDYITEVEISVSIQDFRKSFVRKFFHSCRHTKFLYYAVSADIYNSYKREITDAATSVNAGLMVIYNRSGKLKPIVEIAAPIFNSNAEKLPLDLKHRYMRTGCMKWFSGEFG